MKKSFYFLTLFVFASFKTSAQQTVGLFLNDPKAFNGYTLFSPDYYTSTYLIDNCGDVVNEWTSSLTPGLSVSLLENGNLLRAARTNTSTFGAGGTGGKIEILDWNSNLVWEHEYSSADFHQHHDVHYMPNGNILILAWEKINVSDVIAAGRDPNITPNEFWSEKIVEIQPVGMDSAIIIWEWHAWDHLIQDYDSTKNNFGVVADHPELLDVNFIVAGAPGPGGGLTDWLHCNSIDYNEDLDQILISCHNFSELWIIDHSTTTAQAAGHSGGNSGMGGDILYRWGNPQAYDRGTATDQIFYLQHDARWIEKDLPDEGKIMVYNNGLGRPAGAFSSIEVIECPIDSQGNYLNPGTIAFAPVQVYWNYTAPNPTDFYSPNVSGSQRLPNGNTLITEGASGHIFEVDSSGNILWDYINSVSTTGPVSQGGIPVINELFKAKRYAPDYPGLSNQSLIPGNPVELNPLSSNCIIFTGTDNLENHNSPISISAILQNNQIQISNNTKYSLNVNLYDVNGKLLLNEICTNFQCTFDVQKLKQGVYIINIFNQNKNQKFQSKIIKL